MLYYILYLFRFLWKRLLYSYKKIQYLEDSIIIILYFSGLVFQEIKFDNWTVTSPLSIGRVDTEMNCLELLLSLI